MIASANVPRSKFMGSWTRKSTFDAGYVIPFMVDEILPGDHMRYNVQAYLRMATPLFPIYSSQRCDTFFFFVPCRLLWQDWTKFMGEQDLPTSSIAYTIPVVTMPNGGFAVGELFDHFGLPTVGQVTAGQAHDVSALPARAYRLIMHQWFRDENIQDWGASTLIGAGPDAVGSFPLRRRGKSHDYFTSCLPWPQKFTAPAALGTSAPVIGLAVTNPPPAAAGGGSVQETPSTQYPTGIRTYGYAHDSVTDVFYMESNIAGVPQIFADLSAVSVNVLRQSFMVQSLLERDARGGTRYTELVKSHFGVTSPDARLQRSEYIGGGSTPLVVTPVAQTATGGGGVGALGAAATAAGQHSASYAATEHGYILGLINIRSELSYSQGLHKMWTRSTRYDFYWPSLAMLGEQAVLRKELYCNGVNADDDTVFGYQERWHEYRTRVNEVVGLFRPTSAGNIDEWHLSQQLAAAPALNDTFMQDNPPMSRILAAGASTNQQYLADIHIRREATRPIPMFGTPATLGRF